jgi:hypothetical protein
VSYHDTEAARDFVGSVMSLYTFDLNP